MFWALAIVHINAKAIVIDMKLLGQVHVSRRVTVYLSLVSSSVMVGEKEGAF
jgi:hypothetical protein